MRHVRPLAMVVAATVVGCGCAHNAMQFKGWATYGTERVQEAKPLPVLDGRAVVLRGPTNALNVSIQPSRYRDVLGVVIARAYSALFSFDLEVPLDGTLARLFLPLEMPPHIRIVDSTIVSGGKQIVVAFETSAVGVDLLLAAMFAPGGVRGVVQTTRGEVVEIEAKVDQPWFSWSGVWMRPQKTTTGLTFFSETRFPVYIEAVTIRVAGRDETVAVGKTLSPFGQVSVTLPFVTGLDWDTLAVRKRIEHTAPFAVHHPLPRPFTIR